MQNKNRKITRLKKLIREVVRKQLNEVANDSNAIKELLLFSENDEKLYNVLHKTYVPALQKFINKGVFDENKAIKLLEYYFTNYVRPAYKKEFGTDIKLSPNDRQQFSKEVLKGLKDEGYLKIEMNEVEYSNMSAADVAKKWKPGDMVTFNAGGKKQTDTIASIDGIYLKFKDGSSIPYQSVISEANNTDPQFITDLRNIVDDGSMGKIPDPKTGKKILVDLQSANVVLNKWDNFTDSKKQSFVAKAQQIGLLPLIQWALRNM